MESIWSKQVQIQEREELTQELHVPVAVIGGGMAGIVTAYLLKKKGVECVVLEAAGVGSGQTKGTTAKITLQHGAIYQRLIKKFGVEQAGMYARANQLAIEAYAELVEELRVDCEFREASAYLYTMEQSELLHEEMRAAKLLHISAELTKDTELPFQPEEALRMDGQACFHPLSFLNRIAGEVTVYEHSKVITVEEVSGGTKLQCPKGSVTAKKVVFATHYPFLNVPGFYFMRMHQERSYVLALENVAAMQGMYYGVDEGGLSFRSAGNVLLLGGGSHRTGDNKEGGQYQKLRRAADLYYPGAKETAAWSAQDCMTLDGVPYIGTFAEAKPDWYVGTGFEKWGMTSSMITAMLLSDKIVGREPDYAEMFTPQRFVLSAAAKTLTEEMLTAGKGLSKRMLPNADEQKSETTVSRRCPHLGCELEWNPEEETYDCPCHGSRFTAEGELIDNPAQCSLKRHEQ